MEQAVASLSNLPPLAGAASDIYDGPIMPLANRLLELIKWSQTSSLSSSLSLAGGKCNTILECDTVPFIHWEAKNQCRNLGLRPAKVAETTKSSRISAAENSARIHRKSIEKREEEGRPERRREGRRHRQRRLNKRPQKDPQKPESAKKKSGR